VTDINEIQAESSIIFVLVEDYNGQLQKYSKETKLRQEKKRGPKNRRRRKSIKTELDLKSH